MSEQIIRFYFALLVTLLIAATAIARTTIEMHTQSCPVHVSVAAAALSLALYALHPAYIISPSMLVYAFLAAQKIPKYKSI